jgi:hypothetical protein
MNNLNQKKKLEKVTLHLSIWLKNWKMEKIMQ